MAAASRPRPLAEVLGPVAEEIADLARMAERLQGVISRMAAAGAPDRALMVDAQAADLLSQRLDGLSAFMTALSAAAPDGLPADLGEALRRSRLSEQARRLAGDPAEPSACDSNGELTTFWD
jgi:hypothetical protein